MTRVLPLPPGNPGPPPDPRYCPDTIGTRPDILPDWPDVVGAIPDVFERLRRLSGRSRTLSGVSWTLSGSSRTLSESSRTLSGSSRRSSGRSRRLSGRSRRSSGSSQRSSESAHKPAKRPQKGHFAHSPSKNEPQTLKLMAFDSNWPQFGDELTSGSELRAQWNGLDRPNHHHPQRRQGRPRRRRSGRPADGERDRGCRATGSTPTTATVDASFDCTNVHLTLTATRGHRDPDSLPVTRRSPPPVWVARYM